MFNPSLPGSNTQIGPHKDRHTHVFWSFATWVLFLPIASMISSEVTASGGEVRKVLLQLVRWLHISWLRIRDRIGSSVWFGSGFEVEPKHTQCKRANANKREQLYTLDMCCVPVEVIKQSPQGGDTGPICGAKSIQKSFSACCLPWCPYCITKGWSWCPCFINNLQVTYYTAQWLHQACTLFTFMYVVAQTHLFHQHLFPLCFYKM